VFFLLDRRPSHVSGYHAHRNVFYLCIRTCATFLAYDRSSMVGTPPPSRSALDQILLYWGSSSAPPAEAAAAAAADCARSRLSRCVLPRQVPNRRPHRCHGWVCLGCWKRGKTVSASWMLVDDSEHGAQPSTAVHRASASPSPHQGCPSGRVRHGARWLPAALRAVRGLAGRW